MQKTNINPACYQEMLDSASNAAAKGQSQFFTPPDLGALLAQALPKFRPVITDFNCGNGSLLNATANESTEVLLGSDIDPCHLKPFKNPAGNSAAGRTGHKTTADITRLFELLIEVDWHADLIVLNPPWDLFWYRDRLSALGESSLPAVRMAFATHDGRTAVGTIDSTVASICMALDRCTTLGEGFCIANNATLDRLIFNPGAPHAAIAAHIWGRVIIPGNPMTGIKDHAFSKDEGFKTGIVYFARSHADGILWDQEAASHADFTALLTREGIRNSRRGAELRGDWQTGPGNTVRWEACKIEFLRRNSAPGRTGWNLWLDASGSIGTALSLFDQHSSRILKTEASKLHDLNGKTPMQLVMQRAQRKILMEASGVNGAKSVWRVQPELQAAVLKAVTEYHACRAPLYPLPELQRLGYLEEEDFIVCKKSLCAPEVTEGFDDLYDEDVKKSARRKDVLLSFKAGQRYALSTQSVVVTRHGTRPNNEGELESIEYTGAELATYITDESGGQRCFMESRLRSKDVILAADSARKSRVASYTSCVMIDFTLQELAEHFVIPEVLDVAAVFPELFLENLCKMRTLEAIINQGEK